MPKLPVISGKDLVRALQKSGFGFISQRGDHVKLRHADSRTAIVPLHNHIKKGTLKKGILNPLHITVEELINLIKSK